MNDSYNKKSEIQCQKWLGRHWQKNHNKGIITTIRFFSITYVDSFVDFVFLFIYIFLENLILSQLLTLLSIFFTTKVISLIFHSLISHTQLPVCLRLILLLRFSLQPFLAISFDGICRSWPNWSRLFFRIKFNKSKQIFNCTRTPNLPSCISWRYRMRTWKNVKIFLAFCEALDLIVQLGIL